MKNTIQNHLLNRLPCRQDNTSNKKIVLAQAIQETTKTHSNLTFYKGNMQNTTKINIEDIQKIKAHIQILSQEIGFSEVGFCDLDLTQEHTRLQDWLENNYHGDMQWMQKHLEMRKDPTLLQEGALSAIVVRLDYLPPDASFAKVLGNPQLGYISRYAQGRDYHKVMRKKLNHLIQRLKESLPGLFESLNINYRPFVDSAPILERPLAAKAGLGWVGKHSLLINNNAGSWFFIGEILINLPLYLGEAKDNHRAEVEVDFASNNSTYPLNDNLSSQNSYCGKCQACRTICPTQAIVDDYVVDARRCISYLTIENKGAIPIELRHLIGNRIYGCDDCQLICPHNKEAPLGQLEALISNQTLKAPTLLSLWAWDETMFLKQTEGSPIRRIGYVAWQRNIATALGNIPFSKDNSDFIIQKLKEKLGGNELVDEHILWSIQRHRQQASSITQQQKRLVRSIEKGLPRNA